MSGASSMVRLGLFDTVRVVLAGAESFPLPAEAHSSTSTSAPALNKAVVFRRLFDEYWPLVHHHLSGFLDNQEEVDEITAEVFVVAWRKLRPETPMGLRWFIRTADNKVRDVDRSARSRGRALDAMSRGLENAAERLHPLEALALRQAMKKLNARERQVVVLTYWDELTAGEVAAVLRCSSAAVWTTLTRARTKLRIQLEVKEDGR
ncbi:sigma-70 family RNA polymerase sigma factor [Microbacterium maritypicum]|uniref:Sigma-70 family RNA polymerase sigma factor n=1 Tax=Microbacterium maritypicum TaxID=33918 RepID=A0AAD3X1F8_MICMQ|nr:sigma-70 family RNA polymerase sigma factor [Microbacterium liquefaciens]KAB1883627.1 sigma-70 family RNA polymerase sigma factor [Microbacterium liquefaciens]